MIKRLIFGLFSSREWPFKMKFSGTCIVIFNEEINVFRNCLTSNEVGHIYKYLFKIMENPKIETPSPDDFKLAQKFEEQKRFEALDEITEKRKSLNKCEVCEKTFSCQSNLRHHRNIHTGEKPFECEICGDSFSQLNHLKNHIGIHTREKIFTCNICNKTVNTLRGFELHKRIHTEEKAFNCAICGKSFNQSGNLKVHEKIHTDDKSFKCGTCGEGFLDAGRLTMEKNNLNV